MKEHLKRYAAEAGTGFVFFVCHDGSEWLERYNSEYDLIFMDIKMKQLDGLKTAEAIRKTDSTAGLIFLTSMKQYVWKGCEYHAVNYLLKPVEYGVLKLEPDRRFSNYRGKDEPYLIFSNREGRHRNALKGS